MTTVLPIAWEQLKDAFNVDGSWRDIYVLRHGSRDLGEVSSPGSVALEAKRCRAPRD